MNGFDFFALVSMQLSSVITLFLHLMSTTTHACSFASQRMHTHNALWYYRFIAHKVTCLNLIFFFFRKYKNKVFKNRKVFILRVMGKCSLV